LEKFTAYGKENSGKSKKFFSLRQLVFVVGLLLIAGAWIFVSLQIDREYSAEVKSIIRENENLTKSLDGYVQATIKNIDDKLLGIKLDYERERRINADIKDQFTRALKDPAIKQLCLVNEKGEMINGSPGVTGKTIFASSAFSRQKDRSTGTLYIDNPVFEEKTDQWLIRFSRRVDRSDGKFGGIIVAAMTPEYFNFFYQQMEMGNGKFASITGLDGVVRASLSGNQATAGENVTGSSLLWRVAEATSGSYLDQPAADGKSVIQSYKTMKEYPLIISVGVDKQTALAAYYQRRNIYLGAAFLFTLFVGFGCWTVAGQIKRRNDEQLKAEASISQQNEYLVALHETALALMQRHDLDALLWAIVERACFLTNTPHGFLHLVTVDGNEIELTIGVGIYGEAVGFRLKPGEALSGRVWLDGRPMWVEDYANLPEAVCTSPFSAILSMGCSPLQVRGKVVGVLGIGYTDEKHSPSPAEESLLDRLADIAAIAIDNALLYETVERELRERKRTEEELLQKTQEIQRMAYYDALTGLPNRGNLYRRLAEEMDKANQGSVSGSVMFIDLDDLKMVNDVFGHGYGDDVIITAARYIVDAAGPSGFVSRLGGDEFIVLLPGESNREKISAIADEVVQSLAREYDIGETCFYMSASLGIAVYPEDGNTVQEIIKNADTALYEAKRAGKCGWAAYNISMQEKAYQRMLFLKHLRAAVEKNELYMCYQPQFTMEGSIFGFEALLRWQSPEMGAISPLQFIAMAEESNLIQPIGEWVLREACRFAKRLADMGRGDIHVAVNISPRQLATSNFVEFARNVFAEVGVNPRQIEMEITETVLLTSVEETIQKLMALRAVGVNSALDDFGTGYSSLTYLQRLPVSTLKIDKTFIDLIVKDQAQPVIIGAIVEMAHSLNMTVIAEGVETREQFERLLGCDCDCIQGFYSCCPLPEEEAIRYLSNGVAFVQ